MKQHPTEVDPAQIADLLPKAGRVFIQASIVESNLLSKAFMSMGERLGALIVTGMFLPVINRCTYLANSSCRVETFFMTPSLKNCEGRVRFLPLTYGQIREYLLSLKIDAALFMVSPPDEDGQCSFGPAVDFMAELWPRIPIRIAHLNPCLPRTRGHQGIPFDQITAFVDEKQDLVSSLANPPESTLYSKIGDQLSRVISDGATLQIGVGFVLAQAIAKLNCHRNLRIWSGAISEGVLDLQEAGALCSESPVVTGLAMPSPRLYKAIENWPYEFHPVSRTHSYLEILGRKQFVTVNAAAAVDLFGQCYSEFGRRGFISGPGGAGDFVKAAGVAQDGLRIVVLPSSTGDGVHSNIVLPGSLVGPVSLGRHDTDIVVTENGIADLRNKTYEERALALIDIANDSQREHLNRLWRTFQAML